MMPLDPFAVLRADAAPAAVALAEELARMPLPKEPLGSIIAELERDPAPSIGQRMRNGEGQALPTSTRYMILREWLRRGDVASVQAAHRATWAKYPGSAWARALDLLVHEVEVRGWRFDDADEPAPHEQAGAKASARPQGEGRTALERSELNGGPLPAETAGAGS